MKTLIRSSLLIFTLTTICLFSLYPQEKLSDKQNQWFYEKDWLQGTNALYDASLDIDTFIKHYEKHPERWNKAFKFIHDNDLTTVPLGLQILDDDISLNVQEYRTKEPNNELLEGHKKYIDLQYIVSGVELQGYAKLSEVNEIVKPYSESEDIALYKVPTINYHAIKPNHFTVFFPDDIHITNVQYGEKTPVRKVVFKIKED